jgi:hypothetical protein
MFRRMKMRGTVAKRIRRKTLGEGYSVRSKRDYVTDKSGTTHCKGKRADYQKAKKEYNREN